MSCSACIGLVAELRKTHLLPDSVISIATAIGTSIDAAAVGVGLAFIGVNIWIVAASIGVSTFVLTSIGFRIGGAVGARFGKRAERLGGIALIGIGTLILADHMGWMA